MSYYTTNMGNNATTKAYQFLKARAEAGLPAIGITEWRALTGESEACIVTATRALGYGHRPCLIEHTGSRFLYDRRWSYTAPAVEKAMAKDAEKAQTAMLDELAEKTRKLQVAEETIRLLELELASKQ